MRYRLLGPLTIGNDGAHVKLGGPRQARTMAALLLDANQVVPVRRLVDALWDDQPPAQAVKVARNSVSLLRAALARADDPATVHRTDTGYRLAVPADEVDVLAFTTRHRRARELADAGRTGEAAAQLHAALALWRGPALDGLPSRGLQPTLARLNEEHLAAWEHYADLKLRLGEHDELIGPLGEIAAAHPLREQLIAHLMVALYRGGRQADALATYRRLHQRLHDDLGVDPSPELTDLHRRILRTDPTLQPPARTRRPTPPPASPVPRQLPAATRHFIGREPELATLTGLLDHTGQAGALTIAVIDGSAGIGKTTLALHWAHRIAHRYRDGQIYLNLRGYDPAHAPLTPVRAIRTLLDAFAVEPTAIPADPDSQAALYRSLIANKRMLLVLDNAHDSRQVRPLLPGSPTCLTIVTSRDRLTGLVATDGAVPLTIDLLTTAEARDLLTVRIGPDRADPEPQAIDELIHLCARLPLALNLAAAQAAADPQTLLSALVERLRNAHRRLDALHANDPDADLRAVFATSYRNLPQPAARMFRLLGLHPGPDITIPAAASLAGLPEAEAEQLLSMLAQFHLATVSGSRCFLHDLLRAYATELAEAEESPHDRRTAVQRVLDHYLNTANRADTVLQPNRDRISTPPPATGAIVTDFASYDQAWAWFESEHRTLLSAVAAAAGSYDAHAWRLAWTLSVFLYRSCRWRERVDAQRIAVAAAHRLAALDAQAHTRKDLGQAHIQLREYQEATAHLSQAVELYASLGDARGQVRAHLDLCWVLEQQNQYRDALTHADHACELARAIDYRVGLSDALNNAGWCCAQLGRPGRAVAYCNESLAICQAIAYRQGEARTWDSLGYVHHRLGQHARALECYRHAVNIRRDLGERYTMAATLRHIGDVHHDTANRPAAEAAWLEALALLDELHHPEADELRAKLPA